MKPLDFAITIIACNLATTFFSTTPTVFSCWRRWTQGWRNWWVGIQLWIWLVDMSTSPSEQERKYTFTKKASSLDLILLKYTNVREWSALCACLLYKGNFLQFQLDFWKPLALSMVESVVMDESVIWTCCCFCCSFSFCASTPFSSLKEYSSNIFAGSICTRKSLLKSLRDLVKGWI